VRFSQTPTERTDAPALYGENAAEILDELGLSEEAQTALRESGAVTR
jgi:crotonobetainyl-CoA:carnitine CoA-transferase CaiB-like acyl-CoA transferase